MRVEANTMFQDISQYAPEENQEGFQSAKPPEFEAKQESYLLKRSSWI
jgi:hypothetical protein